MFRFVLLFFLSIGWYLREGEGKVSLEIPIQAVERGGLIACKGRIDGETVDCYVCFSPNHVWNYSLKELEEGKIDLFNRLEDLLPQKGKWIGLVTLENGINTPFDEFEEMSEQVVSKIGEGTLFIGFHIPTEGFLFDLFRSVRERSHYKSPLVLQTVKILHALIERVDAINPELVWVDIRHSGGGIVGRRAIEILSREDRLLLRRHFYLLTLGSAMPIPKGYGLEVHNLYSEADYFTSAFSFLLPASVYNIEILPCSSSWADRILFADHAFVSPTYQNALEETFSFLRQVYGFYCP